jgi:uncharacterized protein YukE
MSAGAIAGAAVLMSLSFASHAQERGAQQPLAAFDDEVAACRRVIRQYCAIVQDMAKDATADAGKREMGLTLLSDARERWARIQKTYASNPPSAYAADAQFKARLQDISNALDDMNRALEAGNARRSMFACGYGCGLFVTMHEENGLVYALDRLFHLRKTIKTASSVYKVSGLGGIIPLMPALLRQRDEALLAPLPWPAGDGRNGAYAEAVHELSTALDELAVSAVSGDAARAGALLGGMTAAVNKPYGLAL